MYDYEFKEFNDLSVVICFMADKFFPLIQLLRLSRDLTKIFRL